MYYPETPPNVAVARIQGGPLAPNLVGEVIFEEVPNGVMVYVYVQGLPPYQPGTNGKPIGPHGFHIHEHGVCEIGDPNDPFLTAGVHWNPNHEPHGNHPGDFPVLFSHGGMAYMAFFTNRFQIDDIIGKSVIIHEHPDDYVSQPSGDAGRRLACGVIERWIPNENRYY
ncbi:MAG TPA: superoxide dismutase family protein [Haloplasmataceae bacterium]